MVTYEVDYLLPGELGRLVNPVIVDSHDGSYSLQHLVNRAPPGAYGFSVFRDTGDDRQLVKSYYINAQLLDQAAVTQQYGRFSYAYSTMLSSGCHQMIRLFDGRLLPFDSDIMEVVRR